MYSADRANLLFWVCITTKQCVCVEGVNMEQSGYSFPSVMNEYFSTNTELCSLATLNSGIKSMLLDGRMKLARAIQLFPS